MAFPFSRTLDNAGRSNEAKMAMIDITTNNSIIVKHRLSFAFIAFTVPFEALSFRRLRFILFFLSCSYN